jgi:hypothetical protein
MIGGAIFVLTGPAIGLAGSAVILAFMINAIITLFTVMAFADTAKRSFEPLEKIYLTGRISQATTL